MRSSRFLILFIVQSAVVALLTANLPTLIFARLLTVVVRGELFIKLVPLFIV